jgi:hypothetical protein
MEESSISPRLQLLTNSYVLICYGVPRQGVCQWYFTLCKSCVLCIKIPEILCFMLYFRSDEIVLGKPTEGCELLTLLTLDECALCNPTYLLAYTLTSF